MCNCFNEWEQNIGLFRVLLVTTFLMIIAVLPVKSLAQVTIEEELELNAQNPSKQKATNDQFQLLSHREPQLIASKTGKLNIYLHELERYKDAIPDSAALVIHIFNKEKDQTKRIPIKQYLDTPLVSQSTYSCRDNWYLYGSGPFTYTRTTWHPSGSEGMVNSSHGQRKNWSDEWESFDQRDENYAGARKLFISWLPPETDNSLRRSDPAIFRAFMDFNFSIPKNVEVEGATLTIEQNQIMPETHPLYLEPDKYIYLHKVNSSWNGSTLTWNNQPGVTGSPIKVKKSSRSVIGDFFYVWYDMDVTSLAKDWVANPEKYHGIRFSLKGGDGKDRILFVSGENNEYERPVISIDFTNPRWSRENSVIPVGNVSQGDTVRFTYDNMGPPQDYSNVLGPISYKQFDGIESVLDTSKVKEGYALSFLNRHKSNLCESRWVSTEFLGAFAFVQGIASDDIILGETKYYAAKWKDPAKKEQITIEEVETDGSGEPIAPSGLITGAFENNPIEVMSGGRSGIYWEKKWATVNSDGSISSSNLPSGMIRVIGRYWEEGKDYKVKLKATAGGATGELEIEVVKPDRLGNKYGKARDVFDEVVDVDSMIIANAGKYGIPPQFIKAHISEEAASKYFGGEIRRGFAPSYLYEPYTVQFWSLRGLSGRFFIEDSSSSYYSDVPDHRHVLFRNYYKETKSVWDIVRNNSQLVDPSNINTYGERTSSGKMDFGDYITVQNNYDEIYNRIAARDTLSESEIAKIANREMAKFLRDDWRGGLKNHIAQTRAASSYGLLQMLHVTAREDLEYDIEKLPENMNTNSFFDESVLHQQELLDEITGKSDDLNSNWTKGYEVTIRNNIFDTWNPKSGYAKGILKRVEEFLPSK